jgi:hypothetical protein
LMDEKGLAGNLEERLRNVRDPLTKPSAKAAGEDADRRERRQCSLKPCRDSTMYFGR